MPDDRVICVNLPVEDLPKSTAFFLSLGFELYNDCSGDETSCLVIGEKAYVMLLAHNFFENFIPGKVISDAGTASEVIVNISAPDREAVDKMIEMAVLAGGKEYREPADFHTMYFRTFQDLDGHIWEVLTLEEEPAPEETQAEKSSERS